MANIKIFKMDDCSWYAAHNLMEFLNWYNKHIDSMVKKGTELLAEMKALATTVELEDDATQIKYRMGISNGTLYFEEITKEASE